MTFLKEFFGCFVALVWIRYLLVTWQKYGNSCTAMRTVLRYSSVLLLHSMWISKPVNPWFVCLGEPQSFDLKFKRAEDYPIDLYYLMDLSYSMKDDLENVKNLGTSLMLEMSKITSDFRIGEDFQLLSPLSFILFSLNLGGKVDFVAGKMSFCESGDFGSGGGQNKSWFHSQ